MRRSPGDQVVWRSIDRAERAVGTAWPRTVVLDEPDVVALYTPVGTRGKERSGERGGPRGRLLLRWDGGHRDIVWGRVNVLVVHRPGDAYSLWFAFDPITTEPRWRYLNLEEPWRPTPIGFDSRDLYLDLWSDGAGREWHWKDEDELEWLRDQGRIDGTAIVEARRIGEAALTHVRERRAPFDRSWEEWRPDPRWGVPSLPAAWSEYEPGPADARDASG